ncbi:leukocidin/hemolysin toxin family protein [Shewanella woodyi]|uniref:leukocidin/hemolysin toxin family protein n=1 Tax=Shewanella woodyi TaxID=60961 RepID=UPI001E49F6DA|nr:leukocidin/hemolysin toxin family protein [Shewanella woodyi]
MSQIIADTVKYKARLKRYLLEINDLIESDPDAEVVEATAYESISDKSKALLYYLFNLFGDESKSAVSYRKFRKLLVKGASCLDVSFEQLTNEEAQISNSFNQHRNWGLHIPESLFTNQRQIHDITGTVIDKHKDTIPVEVYEHFEIQYLTSLKMELADVVSNIEVLEKRMMQDYLILAGTHFQVSLFHIKVKPYKIMDIVQASINTQTKKNT